MGILNHEKLVISWWDNPISSDSIGSFHVVVTNQKNADSLGCQDFFMDFHQHFFSLTSSVCEQTYRFTQFTGCSLATPHFACETGTKR